MDVIAWLHLFLAFVLHKATETVRDVYVDEYVVEWGV